MKLIKLDRRHNLYHKGYRFAFLIDRWSTDSNQIEKAVKDLEGWRWDSTFWGKSKFDKITQTIIIDYLEKNQYINFSYIIHIYKELTKQESTNNIYKQFYDMIENSKITNLDKEYKIKLHLYTENYLMIIVLYCCLLIDYVCEESTQEYINDEIKINIIPFIFTHTNIFLYMHI